MERYFKSTQSLEVPDAETARQINVFDICRNCSYKMHLNEGRLLPYDLSGATFGQGE
jgi:hypothetical protein